MKFTGFKGIHIDLNNKREVKNCVVNYCVGNSCTYGTQEFIDVYG
jgi:hypothetical protein